MLEINNINTYYAHSHVLHGVSLVVPEGKVVVLLGRNGAGKTTTLRSVMGLTPPKDGEISFAGTRIDGVSPYNISRMGLGYVPQGRRLFKSLTVNEHLSVYWDKKGNAQWPPQRALGVFPRLNKRLNNKANELSGGEQQMLAIARALMTGPKLLVMDEPTEGLAPMVVAEVGELINVLKQAGMSILLTEQKMRFALDLADEAYVISKGQIVYRSLPEDLLQNEEIKKTYLGV